MAVFRTVAANTSESALPGTTKPPGFKGAGVRPGGPVTWDWFAVFIDSEGQQMQGGSVTVQWYAVEISGPAGSPTYATPTIGAPVTSAGLSIKRKGFGAGLWPWCTIAATPPVVAAKLVYVTIGDDADGDYSVQVDDDVALVFPASGKTIEEIRDGIVALFVAHPTLTVVPGLDSFIASFQSVTPGTDFTLTLDAPGDALTQQELTPNTPAAASLEIRTTPSAAVEIDSGVVTEALAGINFEAEAAAAITTACAAGGAIRTTLRPDGGGATQTFINGPDEGGGATFYEFYPAIAGRKIWLQHIHVETDKPIEWSVRDTSNITSIGPFAAAVGQPGKMTAGAGGFRSFGPNQGEGLELVITDRTAEVKVSFYAVATDD